MDEVFVGICMMCSRPFLEFFVFRQHLIVSGQPRNVPPLTAVVLLFSLHNQRPLGGWRLLHFLRHHPQINHVCRLETEYVRQFER